MALGIQNMDTLQSEVEVEISAGENKNFQQPKVIKRPVIREIVKEGTGEHIFKCTSEIYCHSDFLAAIQNANIFLDSKYFVDMEGRFSEVVILENFRKLGVNPSKLQLERFVKENFDKPRKALLLKIPEDWTDRPKFLNKIHNDHLKSFSLNVHKTWKTLQRVVRKRKDCPGCATSLIELPLPFILPGGRFRELYYWDSYWILEGLFVSGMCETAKNQLLNFKYLVDTFGFIPNGSRIYYLNRSHPPKFITMVARYINECLPENERYAFVKDFLPSMKREHRFWLDRRTVLLSDPKYPDRVFKLNRYNADTHHARAESYIQDTILAAEAHFDKEQSKILFKHLSTGAESGWDFSSRWMEKPPYELSSIETADIAPVDLNSLLYKNERTMAELCVHVNDEKGHMFYTKLAADRLEAINIFLWSEDNQCWFDYNLKKGASMAGDHPFYVSNFAPIWHEAYDPKEMPPDRIEKILLNQGKLLFEYPGGVPIGDVLSTQQWDFPNVWAPMQHLFIETYERLHRLKDNDLFWRMRAIELARKFVKTAFCGYHRYGICSLFWTRMPIIND